MKAFGEFVLSLGSIALYIYTLSALYGWFAIPAGAPVIGTANIYGLAMIISYVTFKKQDLLDTQDKNKNDLEVTVLRILLSLVTLGVGYIVTLFM